ncbi:PRELI domain-containing protein 2-like [Cimex lectularius]|uniref:PRELI/MSF1 domain-containing protein n=1 Tax=Cimex lectularius TaxID=79782 RepID=A0A8I6SP10_CIMLE|nr:PRELI domain-containing protein 2-like [Cimex lectularius]XP_024085067.1 PRELI domain-containing protein 2-like [Cimex lectularius]
MVLQFSFQHLFKYPVDTVMTSYINIHKHQDDCKETKDLGTTMEGPDMECVRRKLTLENFFSSFFQRIKLLKRDTIEIYEEVWSYAAEKQYWVRTRNISWENELSIAKTVYVSQHHNNHNWAVWDETTVVDLGYFGKMGLALEFYLKRKLEKNSLRDIEIMSNIMKDSE